MADVVSAGVGWAFNPRSYYGKGLDYFFSLVGLLKALKVSSSLVISPGGVHDVVGHSQVIKSLVALFCMYNLRRTFKQQGYFSTVLRRVLDFFVRRRKGLAYRAIVDR